MQQLEQRIAHALTGGIPSQDIAAIIDDVSAALAAAEATIAEETERALDPLAAPDGAAAREAIASAVFDRDRLAAALPRLEARLTEVKAEEYRAAWLLQYAAVEERRDELAKEFRSKYPKAVATLVDLFQRMQAVDAEASRVNQAAPAGTSGRLRPVEHEARDLTSQGLFSFPVGHPSIVEGVRLPNFEQSSTMAWPVPVKPMLMFG